MYILTQLLSLNKEDFLINQVINNFKDKLKLVLDKFLNNFSPHRYSNIIFSLQELMNNFNITFLTYYIESLDKQFKDSNERKKKYYINKSDIERTIVTIFGELTFKRTLYQNKITGEYYFYIDDILNIESYKTYDPVIRGILIDNSVNTNPSNTSFNNPLNILNLNIYLKNKLSSISKQSIHNFKRAIKIRDII